MELTDLMKMSFEERIKKVQQERKDLPDATKLLKDWDESKHSVMDTDKRKPRKVKVKEAILNPDGTVKVPAKYEDREINRIPLPLEQDIVNIHTAFTFGTEPKLTCETEDPKEKGDRKSVV